MALVRFSSVQQMKVAVSNSGNKFFSPEAMRFFGSRIEHGIIAEHYFITSENNFDGSKRLYTVRYFTQEAPHLLMSGEEVGEFQEHATLTDAQVALAAHLSDVEGAK